MKSRILFVDDEILMRWSVAQALTDNHFDVELASSGEEALEKVKWNKFDLVISDLKMDGINGIDVIKKVKQSAPETKVMMISAYGTEEDIASAQNVGICGWMNKPFEMEYFIKQVHKALNSKLNISPSKNNISKSNINGIIFLLYIVWILIWLIGLSIPTWGSPTFDSQTTKFEYRATYLYTIQDAGSEFNKLRTPSSLFFNTRDQELYIIDLGSKRILSFDTNGVVVNEWKNFGKIKTPGSVAVDSRGNLYVGDEIEPLIVILNYFGKVEGYLNLSSIVTTDSNHFQIHKLLMAQNDQLYIGDNKGNKILVIDTFTGQVVRTLCGDEETKLTSLTDMVFDDRGNLIILDGGRNQVMLLNSQGELLRAFGKSGGGVYTLGMASGICYDVQRKWFLVTDATRHIVLVYDQYGECFYEFGGLGKGDGWFYFPRGITIDNNQKVYVLEPNLNRIQIFQIN